MSAAFAQAASSLVSQGAADSDSRRVDQRTPIADHIGCRLHRSTEDGVASLAHWRSSIGVRLQSADLVQLQQPNGAASPSLAHPFRGFCSDDREYFIKTVRSSRPYEISLVGEFVVSAMGRLIGAPVCETELVEVPAALGEVIIEGLGLLEAGIGHGSRVLPRVDESGRGQLSWRQRDANNVRHVGVFALYDWCYGQDQHWLYDLTDDLSTHSHDHGAYFPAGWEDNDFILEHHAGVPHVLPADPRDLDPDAIMTVAANLRGVTEQQIREVLQQVPPSWPVTSEALGALGWFLEVRAPQVADRLEELTSSDGMLP